MARRKRLICGYLALLLVSLALVGCGASEQEEAAVEKLTPQTAIYLKAKEPPAEGEPKFSGRVVPVDRAERAIAKDVYNELPAELQARTPDEVSTVVLLDYREDVVGEYSDGAKAKQSFATLTIVDLKRKRQYTAEVPGPEPPPKKTGGGDKSSGGVPSYDIANYIAGLRR